MIGVSERPDNLAANIVANMVAFGYQGDIHAVGLQAGEVHGIPILASVEALPEDVDLAVILTPAATVPELLDACGRKGIRRAVIESGGFTEFSEEGRALAEHVCAVARRSGLRFVGPNCISVINIENGPCLPFARLDPQAAKRGPVSVLAQSGGVSITYLMLLSQAGLGGNKVASMGNKADLDEVDYLSYLLDDPGTDVIYASTWRASRRAGACWSWPPARTKPSWCRRRTGATPALRYSHGPEAAASRRMAQHLGKLSRTMAKPVAFCAFAQQSEVKAMKKDAPLPIFSTIEGAVQALAASRDRYTHPARLGPLPPPATQRPEEVEALLSGAGVLTTDAALDLCGAFDIPVAPWAAVEDAEAASFAASTIGYPVALKGLVSEVSHKSDGGLIVLGITDTENLQAAFAEVWAALERHTPQAQARRVMVQPMLSGGHEVIVGGKRDPSFGPVVMFGPGGIYVEILEDVAFRLAPLAREDAETMVDEVRGSDLLQGVRGQPPADKGAIIEALLGMSRLLVECPEMVEIDINPLLVFEHGAAAVDARAVVESQVT